MHVKLSGELLSPAAVSSELLSALVVWHKRAAKISVAPSDRMAMAVAVDGLW